MTSDKTKISRFEINNDQFPIVMSAEAREMATKAIKSSNEENLFLRISIKGGGCAGLKYNLDIDDKPSKFDVICRYNDLEVAVDIFSLHYLANTTIDYQETLDGAGFKFSNPTARKSCGCGSSFSS